MSSEPHHWLKLWKSAATDPHLDSLDVADFGRWIKLLLYVKIHGENGVLDIPLPGRNICNQLQIDTIQNIPKLHNIDVEFNAETGVTKITVKKWYKYQVDSSSERVKKLRAVTPNVTPNVTPQEKKRKEKIRKEKIRILRGEFIMLSEEEYLRLSNDFGITELQRFIAETEDVFHMKPSVQKEYINGDHNRLIRNWKKRGYFDNKTNMPKQNSIDDYMRKLEDKQRSEA